jgi:2-methylcitrate dehydratase
VQVFFADGTSTERVEVEYPIGHRRRRAEAAPLLRQKFEAALASRFPADRVKLIVETMCDAQRLDATPVEEFMLMLAG